MRIDRERETNSSLKALLLIGRGGLFPFNGRGGKGHRRLNVFFFCGEDPLSLPTLCQRFLFRDLSLQRLSTLPYLQLFYVQGPLEWFIRLLFCFPYIYGVPGVLHFRRDSNS